MPIHRQAVRKRVDLTVAAEQQPCGFQVVERVGYLGLKFLNTSLNICLNLVKVSVGDKLKQTPNIPIADIIIQKGKKTYFLLMCSVWFLP